MNAGTQNLVISPKTSFEFTFYVLDVYDNTKPPNDPSQTPVNLTGCTGVAKAKAKFGDTTDLCTFTVTFPNPTLGEVKITLSPTLTAGLNFKEAVWDVLVTFPSGQVVKYLKGNLILDPTAS